MTDRPPKSTQYALGYSEQEAERLKIQAQFLRGLTETFFRSAGVGEGMRVLDVGCGVGDVAMLAADLAGPSGTVLGVDRDAGSIDKARLRAAEGGYAQRVSFERVDLTKFQTTEKFDAVVGRYVLLYQSDPTGSLRHLATMVRPGGVLVFHEVDFGATARMHAAPPLWDEMYTLLAEGFRKSGADPAFGLKMTQAFLDAGLGWPTIRAEVPVGGEPGSFLYSWLAATIRSMLPVIEKAGLAHADDIGIETLAARLEEEGTRLGAQVTASTQFGGWVRLPGAGDR